MPPRHVLGPLGFPLASEGKGAPRILQKEPKTLDKGRKTPEEKQGSMPVQKGWTRAPTLEDQEWAWAPRQGKQKQARPNTGTSFQDSLAASLISRVPSATLYPLPRGSQSWGLGIPKALVAFWFGCLLY